MKQDILRKQKTAATSWQPAMVSGKCKQRRQLLWQQRESIEKNKIADL